jgi:DNA modification methylase
MRPSGGAVVMGSFPYPPNGIVELDYEYILLFRKPGKVEPLDSAAREASALSRDEWKTYFSGHWHFAGERQALHEAMFPDRASATTDTNVLACRRNRARSFRWKRHDN